MANLMNPLADSQRGATLVEVLVSMLLMLIGVSGLAGMHTTSLVGVQDSYVRSQAHMLAGNILDRMRANLQLANTADDYHVDASVRANEIQAMDCQKLTCSERELAQWHLKNWKTQVEEYLPNGQSSIDSNLKSGQRRYRVAVSYDGVQGETQTLVIEAAP